MQTVPPKETRIFRAERAIAAFVALAVPFAVPLAVAHAVAACAVFGGGAGARAPSLDGGGAPAADASSAALASARRPREPVVPAPRRPVVREHFGTKVVDDYAWLEDDKDPEVRAFTAAQNALARAYFDGAPDRAKVKERVAALKKSASPDWYALRHEGGQLFALADDGARQQPVLVALAADADPKTARVVVDPNALDPSGKTAIDFFVPSPDRRLVAVSLSKNGTESGDVHVFDVATGKEKGDVVVRVHGGTAGGSVAWNAESTGFWYTRYPRLGERAEPDLDFFQEVWFHRVGTPESSDVYAIGKEFPRIAEVELERSPDGKAVVARVANGDGGEVEHHVLVLGPGSKWTRLTKLEDMVVGGVFGPDGKLYAVSRRGALRGKVIAFSPPFTEPPSEVLAEGDGVIEDLVVTKNALYVVDITGGPSRVRRVPLVVKPEPLAREVREARETREPPKKKGTKRAPKPPPRKPEPPVTIAPFARGVAAAELPLPPVSNVSSAVRVGEDLLLRVESFVDAPAWYRYRASEHRLVKTALAKMLPFDTSDLDVVREACTSKDGTKVPMTIVKKRARAVDGTAPALLTGYGGFGVSVKPRLRPWYRAWLDQDGIVVETNLRGGGELGEAWHRAGMLASKQNVFDDFAACARTLVELGYTKPDKLAIWGRSNGGLLMGAALTQHPEMFRAVVAQVGIYDMLRSELTPNGQFNVTEYGTVKDEPQLRAMLAYSPLHNVKDGVAYPAVLFTTGANDPRVDPFHSRKMVARLQAATSSDRPILLRASEDSGHGAGTPLDAEIEETTDVLVFLSRELGVPFR